MRIKLGDKELEVYNYVETKIKENGKEIPLFSFEYEAFDEKTRKEFKKLLLSPKPITLNVENKEPVHVMVKNFTESYREDVPRYHFLVELIPYKKTYGIEDFTVAPLIQLIKITEGLIKVLKDKGFLTDEEIENAANELFSDEKIVDKILELYYGHEVAEFLKSPKKKRNSDS